MKDYIFLLDDNGAIKKRPCNLKRIETIVCCFLLFAIPFMLTILFMYKLASHS